MTHLSLNFALGDIIGWPLFSCVLIDIIDELLQLF